jgi:ACT domain-containing protein
MSAAEAKVRLAKKLHAEKCLEIGDICKSLNISRSTSYRYVRM